MVSDISRVQLSTNAPNIWKEHVQDFVSSSQLSPELAQFTIVVSQVQKNLNEPQTFTCYSFRTLRRSCSQVRISPKLALIPNEIKLYWQATGNTQRDEEIQQLLNEALPNLQ